MQAQTLDVAKDWELLEAQLPNDWQELGKQHGLLCRELPEHLGAKITELSQILRLVFYYVATNTSLRIATAAAAAAGMVVLSPVALYKWLCKLGPFVTELVLPRPSDEGKHGLVETGYLMDGRGPPIVW